MSNTFLTASDTVTYTRTNEVIVSFSAFVIYKDAKKKCELVFERIKTTLDGCSNEEDLISKVKSVISERFNVDKFNEKMLKNDRECLVIESVEYYHVSLYLRYENEDGHNSMGYSDKHVTKFLTSFDINL